MRRLFFDSRLLLVGCLTCTCTVSIYRVPLENCFSPATSFGCFRANIRRVRVSHGKSPQQIHFCCRNVGDSSLCSARCVQRLLLSPGKLYLSRLSSPESSGLQGAFIRLQSPISPSNIVEAMKGRAKRLRSSLLTQSLSEHHACLQTQTDRSGTL